MIVRWYPDVGTSVNMQLLEGGCDGIRLVMGTNRLTGNICIWWRVSGVVRSRIACERETALANISTSVS